LIAYNKTPSNEPNESDVPKYADQDVNIDGEDFIFKKFIKAECLHHEIEIVVDMETLFSKNFDSSQY